MGRVTYESIVAGLGESLPERTSIVLTSGTLEPPENVIVANGIDEAIAVDHETLLADGVFSLKQCITRPAGTRLGDVLDSDVPRCAVLEVGLDALAIVANHHDEVVDAGGLEGLNDVG